MPEMSVCQRRFCTAAPYRLFAQRVLLPWALQGLRPVGEALEIGAGSGAMAIQLLSTFPDLSVVATDYDPKMVERAGEALRAFGDRAHVEHADASKLSFNEGRFDVVCSFAMLHHVLEWESAMGEAVRVLRPGGQLVGYDVLGTAPMRRLHVADKSDTRMVRPGQLEACLAELPVTNVRTRNTPGALGVRFSAVKAH